MFFISYGLAEIEIMPVVSGKKQQQQQQDAVYKLFLDFTGQHLIITMQSGDNYYLHGTWKKPKLLAKLKVSLTTTMTPSLTQG